MDREIKINLKLNDLNSLDRGLIDHLSQFSTGTGQSERSNEIKRLLRIALLSETYPVHTERKIRPYFADELFARRAPAHDYVDDVPVTSVTSRRIAMPGTGEAMRAESTGADRIPTLAPAVQKPAAAMPVITLDTPASESDDESDDSHEHAAELDAMQLLMSASASEPDAA